MSKNNFEPLTCVIDRFEGGFGILRFEKGQQIIIPKKFLPKDIKEGDILNVEFLTNEQKTERAKNLAKAILSEIFKGS